MTTFFALAKLTAPLFVLIGVGYALTRFGRWPLAASDTLTRFVFTVAIPTLLFRLMSNFAREPHVDARLLVAFFGGCLVVYVFARLIAWAIFRMDGQSQSIFAMGGIFANNVLLGVPLAKVTLGEAALPSVSLVLVFNSLSLWTLVTISMEWARHRDFSARAVAKTFAATTRNPVVASILIGTAFGYTGIALPGFIDQTLELMSQAAIPLSLIAMGMGLAGFGMKSGWHVSGMIALCKLVLHPIAVYVLASLLDLPPLETAAIVMLAALPVGANVYLMSRHFDVLAGPVAAAIVVTTVLAAVTTPLVLTLCGAPR